MLEFFETLAGVSEYESAYLVGSRVMGVHRPDSDYDAIFYIDGLSQFDVRGTYRTGTYQGCEASVVCHPLEWKHAKVRVYPLMQRYLLPKLDLVTNEVIDYEEAEYKPFLQAMIAARPEFADGRDFTQLPFNL